MTSEALHDDYQPMHATCRPPAPPKGSETRGAGPGLHDKINKLGLDPDPFRG